MDETILWCKWKLDQQKIIASLEAGRIKNHRVSGSAIDVGNFCKTEVGLLSFITYIKIVFKYLKSLN